MSKVGCTSSTEILQTFPLITIKKKSALDLKHFFEKKKSLALTCPTDETAARGAIVSAPRSPLREHPP